MSGDGLHSPEGNAVVHTTLSKAPSEDVRGHPKETELLACVSESLVCRLPRKRCGRGVRAVEKDFLAPGSPPPFLGPFLLVRRQSLPERLDLRQLAGLLGFGRAAAERNVSGRHIEPTEGQGLGDSRGGVSLEGPEGSVLWGRGIGDQKVQLLVIEHRTRTVALDLWHLSKKVAAFHRLDHPILPLIGL